jgi:tetratricopeptide (TPR) repeat protein
MVGWCRTHQRVHGWGALSDQDISEACSLARQALEAERDDAETIWQAAWTLFYVAGETAMAAAALDRAVALNPNAAHAWLYRGAIHAHRNEPEPAIAALERARRLSPFDPVYLSLRPRYRYCSCCRAALRTSDRMGRPRPARAAARGGSDAGQDRR